MAYRARLSRSANDRPVTDETTLADLQVTGTLPAALSGMYLRIGPNRIDTVRHVAGWAHGEGMIHSLRLAGGRASYRNRWIITDAAAEKLGTPPPLGPRKVGVDVVSTSVVTFGGAILTFGDSALAYELSSDLGTVRRVDLAGARRPIGGHPVIDPVTGELHLLTSSDTPSQLHVAVSRGGLTRTIRTIDAPEPVRQLALMRDHIAFLADGFVGVTGRATTDTKAAWFEIDTTGREIASVHAHADTAILLATGPSLERWTLQARRGRVNREVLDATPQKVACDTRGQIDVPQRFLWTFGADGAHKHDVRNGRRDSHDFGHQRRASELVFVVDPDRRGAEDGGWLVGLVHDAPREVTDFVVLDAQFVERPPVALVHIPRRVPNGTHATWFPAWSSSSNATYDPS